MDQIRKAKEHAEKASAFPLELSMADAIVFAAYYRVRSNFIGQIVDKVSLLLLLLRVRVRVRVSFSLLTSLSFSQASTLPGAKASAKRQQKEDKASAKKEAMASDLVSMPYHTGEVVWLILK